MARSISTTVRLDEENVRASNCLSKVLDVEVTPRAAIQLEAAATWWMKNRQAAPDAIRVDFHEVTTLLSRQPGVGARSSTARYPDLRRLYLSRVRYHI
jgi:hypothetical protein